MSSISDNAALQTIDDHDDLIILYYADFSMCPFDQGRDDMIERGAIVVTIFTPDEALKDSSEFQEKDFTYFTSIPDNQANIERIEVNGYKGIGWEPYRSASIIRLDGSD